MENLLLQSRTLASLASAQSYRRPLYKQIDWSWRMNGIRGPRGVGKTTLMLQRLIETDAVHQHSIYLTLDDLYFSEHLLTDTVKALHQEFGITHFYIDEVHKYPEWSRELKNLYDLLPNLHLVFTGSSIIQLYRQNVDLSRRAIMYDLQGLSFREYLILAHELNYPLLRLEELLTASFDICRSLPAEVPILQLFKKYLSQGYYPIILENELLYPVRVRQMIEIILRVDLSSPESGATRDLRSLQRLLQLIAESPPFKPNFSKLAERMSISRTSLHRYFQLLEEAQLITTYTAAGKGFSKLQKPEKVYLDNPNLAQLLAPTQYSIGAVREVYFQNQLRSIGQISIPKQGDFFLDGKYTFEIGGPNKTFAQLKRVNDAYLAIDGIIIGTAGKIPLWMFGLLA